MTLPNNASPGELDHAADHNQIVAAVAELSSRVDAVGVLSDYEADAAASAAAAAVSRDAAAASAVTAAAAAGTATTQAGNASTSAGTAASEADDAEAAAAAALASQNAAASSASTATTQAGVATTQAGLATTERTNAGLSAAAAESDADAAAASAAAALVSQNAAAVSQSSASSSSASASASAVAAAASAADAAASVASGVPVTYTGSSASPIVKITQTGAGPALLVEDSASTDSTPFVINASGNVGIGTSTVSGKLDIQESGAAQVVFRNGSGTIKGYIGTIGAIGAAGTDDLRIRSDSTQMFFGFSGTEKMRLTTTGLGIGGVAPQTRLHIYDATSSVLRVQGDSATSIQVIRLSTDANGPQFNHIKYRGTLAAPAAASSGDVMGDIAFSAYDGAASQATAMIRSQISGAVSAGVVPSTLLFLTGATNSASLTERMRIDSAGNVGIGVTPTSSLDVGSASAYQPQVTVRNTNVDANGAYLFINKMPSDNTIATSDNIGNLFYQAANTSGVAKTVAGISVAAEGANTAEAPPGRMLFYVANSAGALSERMRIDNAGLITGTGSSLGAWTAYTPTLGGTGWAIGDGTAYGHYCRVGKIVHFRVLITLGATSTAGAGIATITGPVTSANTVTYSEFQTSYYDASGTTIYTGAARMDANSTTIRLRAISSSVGALTAVVTTTPFTWATTDSIIVSGTYEAA